MALKTASKQEAPRKSCLWGPGSRGWAWAIDRGVEAWAEEVATHQAAEILPSIFWRAGGSRGQRGPRIPAEVGTLPGSVAALASQRDQEVWETSR